MPSDRTLHHGALAQINKNGSKTREWYIQLCVVAREKFKSMGNKFRQLVKDFYHPLNVPHYVKGIFVWKCQNDSSDWTKLKGLIVLEGYTTGAVNGTEDIFIVCQTKESFRFVARSKKERDAWVSVLQEGMTSHDPLPNNHYDTVRRRSPSPVFHTQRIYDRNNNITYNGNLQPPVYATVNHRNRTGSTSPLPGEPFESSMYAAVYNGNRARSVSSLSGGLSLNRSPLPPIYASSLYGNNRARSATSLRDVHSSGDSLPPASLFAHNSMYEYSGPIYSRTSTTLTPPVDRHALRRNRRSYEQLPFHLRGYDTLRSTLSDESATYRTLPASGLPNTMYRVPATSLSAEFLNKNNSSKLPKKIPDSQQSSPPSSSSSVAGADYSENIYACISHTQEDRKILKEEREKEKEEEHIYLTPVELSHQLANTILK